jgi:hypothetical protein
VSRYDLFRRRLAPIALFIALALIAKDSCDKDNTRATVEIVFGADTDKARIREVDAEVWVGTELLSAFHRVAAPGALIGPCRFEVALPERDGELRIEVDLGDTQRRITRRFHALDDATITVTIAADELR